MTGQPLPYEQLADYLADEAHVMEGGMLGRLFDPRTEVRKALERLDLYVVSGAALADVLERAMRDGAQAAQMHEAPALAGVAKLIRDVLAGHSGHGDDT